MFNKGVVVNETYGNAIIRLAYEEDFVDYYGPGKTPYAHPYSKRIMNSGLNPRVRENALWAMLLFGNTHIKEVDNFDVRKLIKEDIATFYSQHKDPTTEWFKPAPMKKFIINDLRRRKIAKITSAQFDNLIEIAADKKAYEKMLMSKAPRRLSSVSNSGSTGLIENSSESLRIIHNIMQICYKHNSIINYSNTKKIPGFIRTGMPNKYITKEEIKKQPEDVIKVVHIALTGLKLPRLDRISQVLELREDKYIDHFREILLQWTDFIKNDDKESEDKIRKEIYKANEEMKSVGVGQRIGAIITVLSAPTLFFDGGMFSAALIFGGVATLMTELETKKKYRWLLFGT